MRVMGVDLGIKKIAWAVWEDDFLTATGAYESQSTLRPRQLESIGQEIRKVAVDLRPDHIFIEDTLIGNNRKYSIKLAQTMGAVMAFLAYESSIYLANVSTWKKETIGNGNAGKPLIRDYINSLNPAYHDLCGDDQDRYDAACIGYYGGLIAKRAEHLEGSR